MSLCADINTFNRKNCINTLTHLDIFTYLKSPKDVLNNYMNNLFSPVPAIPSCHIYSSLANMTDTTNTSHNTRKNSSRNSFNREHAALIDHHAIYKNTFIITSSIFQVFFKIIPAIVLLLPASSPSTG